MNTTVHVLPGSTPVVTSGGVLLGYVFPVPTLPPDHDEQCTHGAGVDHWAYALTSGHVPHERTRTREDAVTALVEQHGGQLDLNSVELVDLDLAEQLHRLAYPDSTPRVVAHAALMLASGRSADALESLLNQDVAVEGPPWLLRTLLREVLLALFGPITANDVLGVYDAVAADTTTAQAEAERRRLLRVPRTRTTTEET